MAKYTTRHAITAAKSASGFRLLICCRITSSKAPRPPGVPDNMPAKRASRKAGKSTAKPISAPGKSTQSATPAAVASMAAKPTIPSSVKRLGQRQFPKAGRHRHRPRHSAAANKTPIAQPLPCAPSPRVTAAVTTAAANRKETETAKVRRRLSVNRRSGNMRQRTSAPDKRPKPTV